MLRWLTAGESHGPALVAILEGMPAGVHVTTADLARALQRRRAGYGRGARMTFEQDDVEITAGVRHGRGADRQHRMAEMAAGDVGGPGRSCSARRPGAKRAAVPAPPGPCRPGG